MIIESFQGYPSPYRGSSSPDAPDVAITVEPSGFKENITYVEENVKTNQVRLLEMQYKTNKYNIIYNVFSYCFLSGIFNFQVENSVRNITSQSKAACNISLVV